MRAIQKCTFLLNLSNYVKSYGHFCQILGFFTMSAPQMWSCRVTHEANFKDFLFCPNSTFIIGKSHKISSGKLYFRSYQPKTSQGGVEGTPPPSAFRVKACYILKHLQDRKALPVHIYYTWCDIILIFKLHRSLGLLLVLLYTVWKFG